MFGFLKNLLRKQPDAPAGSEPGYSEAASPSQFEASHGGRITPSYKLAGHSGRGVEVPLRSILGQLPLELQPRVLQTQVGDLSLSVPLEKILSQLARGNVRISFGELRQAAPGIFSAENDRDRVMVTLPLGDILPQVNPALIQRRRTQKHVDVPSEITSPFDPNRRGLTPNVPVADETEEFVAPEPAVAELEPQPLPPVHLNARGAKPGSFARQVAPGPAMPAIPPTFAEQESAKPAQKPAPIQHSPPPRSTIPFKPITPPAIKPATPPAKTAPPAKTTPPAPARPVPPAAKSAPSAPILPVAQPAPVPPAPASSRGSHAGNGQFSPPAAAGGPHPPIRPLHAQPSAGPAQAPGHAPAPAAAAPVQPARPPVEIEVLPVTLSALAEAWPEPVRREIVQLKLVDSKVCLPLDWLEQGLKKGKLVQSWKDLSGWIKGASLPPSLNDSVLLELPLRIVAPLFLARGKDRSGTQKVVIDDNIPNLFFGFPEPGTPAEVTSAAAPSKQPDTNYYSLNDGLEAINEESAEQIARRPSPGTSFVAKYATPNEIVSRAASLDGVSGALIALPDGLLVASRLPQDLNADTLAAFLPQIFSKVSQCTKELRMGELNNLNFTVGNVPWKIFRVNAIFFAAFGRAGEPMATGQLAALAGELDHKPK